MVLVQGPELISQENTTEPEVPDNESLSNPPIDEEVEEDGFTFSVPINLVEVEISDGDEIIDLDDDGFLQTDCLVDRLRCYGR